MSSSPRGTSGKKARKIVRKDEQTKARIKDLRYYLGDDWIDWTVQTGDSLVNHYRNSGTTAYQPKKCPVCKKYWSYFILSHRAGIRQKKLDTHFNNLPAISEKCEDC
tara:strand:- start:2 stop:322 length:321 start_codon:yes stop_codon:yes gene_type:complete